MSAKKKLKAAYSSAFGDARATLNRAVGLFCDGTVVRLIARFTMRADLEEHFNGPEPLGLRLSAVMTFFFGGIYFQYKLNEINEIKQTLRYRNAAR